MSFFMKSKKKAIRKIAIVAGILFVASVALGAGVGALDWISGEGQQQVQEMDMDSLEEQVAHLEERVEEDPENVNNLVNLGLYQLQLSFHHLEEENNMDEFMNNIDEAERSLEDALELEPDNVEALHYYAVTKLSTNQYDEAIESLNTALEQDGLRDEEREHFESLIAQAETMKDDAGEGMIEEELEGDLEDTEDEDEEADTSNE